MIAQVMLFYLSIVYPITRTWRAYSITQYIYTCQREWIEKTMEITIWPIIKNISKMFLYFVCYLFCRQIAHVYMERSVGWLVDWVKEQNYKQNYKGGVTAGTRTFLG